MYVSTWIASAAYIFLACKGTALPFRTRIKFNLISLCPANRRFWQVKTEDITGCLLGVNTHLRGWWKKNMEWRLEREKWKYIRGGTRPKVTTSIRSLTDIVTQNWTWAYVIISHCLTAIVTAGPYLSVFYMFQSSGLHRSQKKTPINFIATSLRVHELIIFK
jgi:hypothetical protein